MPDIDEAMLAVRPVRPNPRHLCSERRFQGIPGIEVTSSGKLYATWYSGGVTEGPENYVVLSESIDNGDNWKETWIIDPPGKVRAYDPTLWIDPLGRLWWFWAQCYSREDLNISDGRNGVWAVVADNPDRPEWSPPFRIANGIMMNKPTVLANGDWAFPTAVWKDHGGAPCPTWLLDERLSNIVVSSDQGKTFSRRGGADVPCRHFDEHMIVELNDGRLWMLVRTFYGIGQSFSRDGGASWTPGCDSLLGGPGSRFFMRRLRSGRLLLVNHTVDVERPTCRKNLRAYLSDDDGKSWQGGLMIDEREGVSYPDGAQDKEGIIRIIYDRNRYEGGEILMAEFREEDVMSGACVSPGARLRVVISSYPFKK